MQHVVMFSGGAGSWMTAKRVAEKHGTDNLILLFADTLIEDEDLYRFLDEAAANVGGQLIKVAEGRDPWQVFFDVRFLGNSRVDPCSRILKREFLRRWLEEHCDPASTTVYLGIDWTEAHRFERAQRHWVPWRVEAPLCSPPYLTKDDILAALRAEGIRPPRLYELGFSHNNCGGFCIKAGQAHFALLYRTMPERYLYHERREQELRDFLGKNVAILLDRRGGGARPMTLREFRERLEANDKQIDMSEWGGCGCFSGDDDVSLGDAQRTGSAKKHAGDEVRNMIRRNRYVSPIKPWKHQAKALKQLHKKGSALLWADVGIGKTKIAVDYALSKGFSKVLVVGPLAAVGVWRNEFYKHDPHLHIVTSNDVATHDELLPLIHNARKQPRSVIIVTYNALVKFVKLLADSYVPDLFIVDESQYIRNYSAVRTRRTLAVARASAHRLLLSGTPCPNGYHELYYQIKAVHPGILPPTIQGFRDRYCRLGGYMGKEIVGYKNVTELAKKLAQVTIRIPKSVLDLPPVMDQIIPVKLEPKAMKIYKKLEKEMVVDIESEGKEIKAEHHLVKLLRLQQITGGMLEGHKVSNAKLDVLKDIVQQETGKLVIFVQFVQEIRRITEMLSKLGISHDVIRGGKTGTQRDRIIEDFQTKPDPRVLVTQIQAGGVAITLTAASVAIFYSLNYNSEAYEQARGRIHRGGQTERCRYIHLLCEHTIDYDIYSALGYKMNVQELLGHVVRRYHDRASGA